MRTAKKTLLEMEHTRMVTLSFDSQGVTKLGEIVLQRQSRSQSSGRRHSVFNDDLFTLYTPQIYA
jgi:hypothetical protein